jgi:RNA polymerase sigma-70 factor (ECF subfamily)
MGRQMMEIVSVVSGSGPAFEAQSEAVEILVTQAARGDVEAFRLIFERYARPILSFIYDMVGQRELAEDLTQETFVRAHRSMRTLREPSKLSTWLFGIARNTARELIRRRMREGQKVDLEDLLVVEMDDGKRLPEAQLLNRELNGVIRRALIRLDEDKRTVFTLKILHQRSYDEISQITGFSIPKLKTDLHRARAEMRRHIQPYLEVSHDL